MLGNLAWQCGGSTCEGRGWQRLTWSGILENEKSGAKHFKIFLSSKREIIENNKCIWKDKDSTCSHCLGFTLLSSHKKPTWIMTLICSAWIWNNIIWLDLENPS